MTRKDRSLKSRCWQGHAPSETLGRILPFLTLASGGSQQSLTFLNLQLHQSNHSLCDHSWLSPCVPLSSHGISSSCKDNRLGPTLLTSLTWIISEKAISKKGLQWGPAYLCPYPGLLSILSAINVNFMELERRVEMLVGRMRIYKGSVFENIGLKSDSLSVG